MQLVGNTLYTVHLEKVVSVPPSADPPPPRHRYPLRNRRPDQVNHLLAFRSIYAPTDHTTTAPELIGPSLILTQAQAWNTENCFGTPNSKLFGHTPAPTNLVGWHKVLAITSKEPTQSSSFAKRMSLLATKSHMHALCVSCDHRRKR